MPCEEWFRLLASYRGAVKARDGCFGSREKTEVTGWVNFDLCIAGQ
jgi:hypothetical protein